MNMKHNESVCNFLESARSGNDNNSDEDINYS